MLAFPICRSLAELLSGRVVWRAAFGVFLSMDKIQFTQAIVARMLPSQALASLDQMWFAAAKNCSLHSSTCSLHNTQQRRKGQGRLQHQKSRAGHADGGAGEKAVRNSASRVRATALAPILKAARDMSVNCKH